MRLTMERAYTAGLDSVAIKTMFKSAAITTVLFALASALLALYLYNKK